MSLHTASFQYHKVNTMVLNDHNNMQWSKDKIQSDMSGMSTLQSDITCLFRDIRATSD